MGDDCGHSHTKPIFFHLGVEDFVLQTSSGDLVNPVVMSIVDYTEARRADGFEGCMTILVYPILKPSVLMCFVWRGQHMRLFSMNESAEEVLSIQAWLTKTPEIATRTVDQLLQHTFDPMPIPKRLMSLVVPSAQDIKKAN